MIGADAFSLARRGVAAVAGIEPAGLEGATGVLAQRLLGRRTASGPTSAHGRSSGMRSLRPMLLLTGRCSRGLTPSSFRSRETRPGERGNTSAMASHGTLSTEQLVDHVGPGRSYCLRPGLFPRREPDRWWEDVAHYTQMVWPTTRTSAARSFRRSWDYLICRYSPPGNKDGKPVFVASAGRRLSRTTRRDGTNRHQFAADPRRKTLPRRRMLVYRRFFTELARERVMPRWGLLMAPALFCLAMPAAAQDVAPVAVPEPAVVPTAAPVADSNVGPFYEARPSTLIWLRDAASRAAANRLIEILKRAPIDGLAEGPELASSVETALAGGTAADDETISTAWVRYVQALRKPVDGSQLRRSDAPASGPDRDRDSRRCFERPFAGSASRFGC